VRIFQRPRRKRSTVAQIAFLSRPKNPFHLPIDMTRLANTSSKSNDSATVGRLYRVMNGLETALGGGEGIEGLYGSITATNMELLLRSMEKVAGLNSSKSVLMDVGSGLCRPLIHALATGRVASCRGVEIDPIKCTKAEAFLVLVKKKIRERGLDFKTDFDLDVVCSGIESIPSLGPVTHVYSFWEGVPVSARVALGKIFRESMTAKAICVVQRSMRCESPAEFMSKEYGFGPLRLVDSRRVSMSGSGRSFMAYIFVKMKGDDPIRRKFACARTRLKNP
jgi:hypothetical protein